MQKKKEICGYPSASSIRCYLPHHEKQWQVGWLEFNSAQIWLYQRWKVRGGELSLPM